MRRVLAGLISGMVPAARFNHRGVTEGMNL